MVEDHNVMFMTARIINIICQNKIKHGCRRLPPVTALGSRRLRKDRRQLPARFRFTSQKNN